MSAHTPGPWRALIDGPLAHARIESPALTVANGIVNHANARLIAAAPDLYLVVRKLVHHETAPDELWERARAALAKAEGSR